MSAETGGDTSTETETSADTSTETTQSTETTESKSGGSAADLGISAADLAALRGQIATFAADKAKREAADEKARVEKAEKAGEHQKLYEAEKTARAAADERIAKYEAAETARTEKLQKKNAAALKKMPANLRALVPASLTPEQAADQIALLQGASGSGDDRPLGGRGGGGGGDGSPIYPAEFKAYAKKVGREPSKGLHAGWLNSRAGRAYTQSKGA